MPPGGPGNTISVTTAGGRVISVAVPPTSPVGSTILVSTAGARAPGAPPAQKAAGGVKVKATKSFAAPALLVASAAGVAAAVAVFAAPQLDPADLGVGVSNLVDAAAALEPAELLEAVRTCVSLGVPPRRASRSHSTSLRRAPRNGPRRSR